MARSRESENYHQGMDPEQVVIASVTTQAGVLSFVSQFSNRRDSRATTPPSLSPPPHDKAESAQTPNCNLPSGPADVPSPPTSLSATPPLEKRVPSSSSSSSSSTSPESAVSSYRSSPSSLAEPFPEILPSHFPAPPPTPPIEEDEAPIAAALDSHRPVESGKNGVSASVGPSRANTVSYRSSVPAPASAGRQRSVSAVSQFPNRERSSSRPLSLVQTYQPHVMDITDDTPPELQPTFTFLNNHGNKLYQEGYFLKLDDQNAQGRTNPDRSWHECFAQLVGTVLSLWDAAELDAAGEDGEVLPKFLNITDASIKMIESLKMSTDDNQELQNCLSISTAGRNRYLLHFNSHHSLVQWTSAIRLAMFEHATLQEAYTGALIAGKAKGVNNINVVMERAVLPTEDWVRVRFGAGVPWRRCWCVVTPPSAKEIGRAQKEMRKRSPYDRSPVVLRGDVKFYDARVEGRRRRRATPFASVTDAYAAYAIYPQAKSLIDASTLIKIEGTITVHSDPPSSTDGFVFIMPEVHPAVSGFETMLRFLFPVWDTFALYGRPGKLVASPHDPRALMFAMPRHKRYGYLEILDVAALVAGDGSQAWGDREWRRRLKELTGRRRAVVEEGGGAGGMVSPPGGGSRSNSRAGSRRSVRLSVGLGFANRAPARVGFADDSSSQPPPPPPPPQTLVTRGSRSFSLTNPPVSPRMDHSPVVPGSDDGERRPRAGALRSVMSRHLRNSSDPLVAAGGGAHHQTPPSPPPPPPASDSTTTTATTPAARSMLRRRAGTDASEYGGMSSDDERPLPALPPPPTFAVEAVHTLGEPEPVARPPRFSHDPQSRPPSMMYPSPEMRRANNRLSNPTLTQLASVGRAAIHMDPAAVAGTCIPESDSSRLGDWEVTDPFPSVQHEPYPPPFGVPAASSHPPPPIPPTSDRRPQSPGPGPGSGWRPPHPSSRPGTAGSSAPVPPPLPQIMGRGGSPVPIGARSPHPASGPLGSGAGAGAGAGPDGRNPPRPPGLPEQIGHPMALRPGTGTTPPPEQQHPRFMPQRTTNLQRGDGGAPARSRSSLGDAAASSESEEFDVDDYYYGDGPRMGVPKTVGGPAASGSPTDFHVPAFEFAHNPALDHAPGYAAPRSRDPLRHPFLPRRRHQTPDRDEPGVLAWQPPVVSSSGTHAPGRSRAVSPERFVQDRARRPGPGPRPEYAMPGPLSALARSVSYDGDDYPAPPLPAHDSQSHSRPGSASSAAEHVMRGMDSPLYNVANDHPRPVQGFGISHREVVPQRAVIVDPAASPRRPARPARAQMVSPPGHLATLAASPPQLPRPLTSSPLLFSAGFAAGDFPDPSERGRPQPPPRGISPRPTPPPKLPLPPGQ